MSDYSAIAAVSNTLKALLEDRMDLPLDKNDILSGKFKVTISNPQPRAEGSQPTTEEPRINLFLYQITENIHLKNQDLPGHGHPNSYGRPPLSLDLHYLVTAHGSSMEKEGLNESLAQKLLGSAMRVFHDHPVIDDRLVKIKNSSDQILDESLRGQVEQIKLRLEPISLEDLSKIWTALTSPYRLSAAYAVSVVQIESLGPRRYPLPVGQPPAGPQVYVVP